MKRIFAFLAMLMLSTSTYGQAISWRALDTNDFSSNNFVLSLRSSSPTNPVVIIYAVTVNVTTNFVEYNFSTNLYSTTINTTTNFVTYSFSTNIFATTINATTNYIEYSFTTNLNVKNLRVDQMYVTNIYALDTTITNGLYFHTNNWTGPTNTLDMRHQKQSYGTFTPMEITGLINRSNYVAQSVVLTLTNAASTNVQIFIPADVRTGDGARSYYVSNAQIGVLSLEYDPSIGTNAVYRAFY